MNKFMLVTAYSVKTPASQKWPRTRQMHNPQAVERNGLYIKCDWTRSYLVKMLKMLCALCGLLIPLAFCQTVEVTAKPLTDADIQLLRSDVQADKNQIIAPRPGVDSVLASLPRLFARPASDR